MNFSVSYDKNLDLLLKEFVLRGDGLAVCSDDVPHEWPKMRKLFTIGDS